MEVGVQEEGEEEEEVEELLLQLVVGVEEEEDDETEGPGVACWHEQEEGEVDGPCLEGEEEVLQSPGGKVEGVEEQMLELWKEEGEVALLAHGQGVGEEEVQSCEVGVGEEDRHVMEEVEVLKERRGGMITKYLSFCSSVQQTCSKGNVCRVNTFHQRGIFH